LGDAEAPADFLSALAATGVSFVVDEKSRADHGRDWWPLSLSWVAHGVVPSRPGVVVYPSSVDDVSSVLRLANEHGVAVTPQGGRSSVVGGALPSPGGVALDLTRLNAVLEVDEVRATTGERAASTSTKAAIPARLVIACPSRSLRPRKAPEDDIRVPH